MNELIDFSHLKFDKDSNSGSDEKYNDLYNNEWYMFKFGTPLPPNDKNPIQASYESAPARKVLLYLTDRIDIDSINNLIENCPALTPVKVEFFKSFVKTRLDSIILPAYSLAKEERGLAKTESLESIDQLLDAKKDEADLISGNSFTAVSKAMPSR